MFSNISSLYPLPTAPIPVPIKNISRSFPMSPGGSAGPRAGLRWIVVGISTALAQQTDVYMCTEVSLPGDGQEGLAV